MKTMCIWCMVCKYGWSKRNMVRCFQIVLQGDDLNLGSIRPSLLSLVDGLDTRLPSWMLLTFFLYI
jgi:hypothetical protein